MLGFIFEVIASLILILYYVIESIVIKLVPVKLRNSKNVSGQVVVVTGAGGGIGRLLALKLARLGCKVVCWDVIKQGLNHLSLFLIDGTKVFEYCILNLANDETVRLIQKENGEAYAYQVDLIKKEDVYQLADQVKKEIGNVRYNSTIFFINVK